MYIGNASGFGRTYVRVGSVNQFQSGAMNNQSTEIGNNSSGGSTRVSVGSVTQSQGGAMGNNTVRIGNR